MAAVTFDQALDFTRGSEGTYIGADGLIKTAAVDEPRFTHDPETNRREGLLIEEQRTNLMLHSEDATQGFVRDPSNGDYTVVANQAVAPDGNTTADLVECISATGIRNGQYTLGRLSSVIAADSARSHSLFIKRATSRYVTLLIHQEATTNRRYNSTFDFDNPSSPHLGNGWYRLTLSRDSFGYSVSDVSISFGPDGNSTVGSVYVWGWQTELGSSPTSYIPTEVSQVTRAADSCSRTLGAEFRNDKGRFIVTAKAPVGITILAAGTLYIVSDSEDLKEYDVSYGSDIEATDIQIVPSGNGVVESIYYLPTPEAN